MTGYIIAAAFVLWAGALFGTLYQTALARSTARAAAWAAAWAAVLFGVLTLGLGTALNFADQQAAVGPCLRYETGVQYNPATKTVMPYRRCAERGEWITEGME